MKEKDTETPSVTDTIVLKCNQERNNRGHNSMIEAQDLEIRGNQHLISNTL